MKVLIKYILTISLLLSFFSANIYANNNDVESVSVTSFEETIESQIRSFAKSINQSNADDSAALSLAKHGMTGGGKTLKVGKNHALTATLMNSELAIGSLTDGVARGIYYMEAGKMNQVLVNNGCNWNLYDSYYQMSVYDGFDKNALYLLDAKGKTYIDNKFNSYDESLNWISGSTDLFVYITRKSVTKDLISYSVKAVFGDRFDFDTSNGSEFQDLISGIGAIFFKEFSWEATVEFTITMPNTCLHEGNNYHMYYDETKQTLISSTVDDFKNDSQYLEYKLGGVLCKYYGLRNPMHLLHNQPWVLEYSMKKSSAIAFSLSEYKDTDFAYVLINLGLYVFIPVYHNGQTHYYGTDLWSYIAVNDTDTYTVRLYNKVEDNDNHIYVSIFNETTQHMDLEPRLMNKHYVIENQSWKLMNDNDNMLSGKDFHISFIGNKGYGFKHPDLSLKVYEDGIDNKQSHFKEKVTKPTCSEKGYTTFECDLCGYTYKGNYTNTIAHKYTSKVTQPTCTEQGYTTYTCSSCKDSYKGDYVSKLGHSFSDYVSNHDATLYEDGTKSAKCDRCSEVSTIVDEGTKLYVTALEISKKPSKLEYYEGEELDLCDMEVIAYLNNHTSVPFTDYEASGYDNHVVGSQVVNISYMGYSDSFIVVVNKRVDKITSSVFNIVDGIISKFNENTSVQSLLDGLDQKEYIKVLENDVEVSSESLVATGMVVKVVYNEDIYDELTIVVTGDVNCDGKITITDMLGVKGHVLEKNTYEGYLMMAADTSGDGKVTITDFIQIKSHILGKSIIEVR